jgi:hypothetical protein
MKGNASSENASMYGKVVRSFAELAWKFITLGSPEAKL